MFYNKITNVDLIYRYESYFDFVVMGFNKNIIRKFPYFTYPQLERNFTFFFCSEISLEYHSHDIKASSNTNPLTFVKLSAKNCFG